MNATILQSAGWPESDLAADHSLLQRTVRGFAAREIAPHCADWDERSRFPTELIGPMRDLGLWGMSIPRQYGGTEADALSYALVTMEFARVDASAAFLFFLHNGISTRAIVRFGSEDQKRRFLPDMATGARLGGWAMTEPGAGSDAPAMRTTARRDGDEYVLNGRKVFCSLGGMADVYVVLAKTEPARRAEGVSLFIVERGTSGFTFGREERKLGLHAVPLRELVFEDCRVPGQNLLLEAPEAFRRTMDLFNTERLGNSSCSLGIAVGAWEMAAAYVKQRQAFEKHLSEFQGLRWMLADMALQIESTRLLVFQTARLIDSGRPVAAAASMMKIYANEMVQRVVNDALQLFGAYGYTREAGIERKLRDARGLAIAGGTPQVLRNTLAHLLLD